MTLLRQIAFVLIWFTILSSGPALAIMDCSMLERRIEARVRTEQTFVQADKFERYKAEAEKLIAKVEGGKTLLEIRLENPNTNIADLLPKDPLGVAAYYEVFANYRSAQKIEIGKYLTASAAEMPERVRPAVERLRRWLEGNPIAALEAEVNAQGLRIKQRNRKWYKNMQEFVELAYTIEQYGRLESYENATVRQKLTTGFLNFLKNRRNVTNQRRLVETELMKDNFANVVQKLGLTSDRSTYIQFRKGMEKYQNTMGNIFQFVLMGGITLGAMKLGAPINWTMMLFGVAPGLRAKLQIPPQHRERILEIVRTKGYDAALKEIKPYFRNRVVAEHTIAYLRIVLQISMIALIAQFLNEYGETIYNGVNLYFAFQNITQEDLAKAEAQMTNEDIRVQILENKMIEFADVFGIDPETDDFERVVRSGDFVKEVMLADLVQVICAGQGVKGRDQQVEYVLNRYDSVINAKDLHVRFIEFMGATIFELWQDSDINEIRAFTSESTKPEVDFCSGNYRPTIFMDRSVRQAIVDFI